MKHAPVTAGLRAGGFLAALGILFLVVAVLFHGVFIPGQTLFSNDGPLGQLMAQCHRLPDRFWGCWQDLNNVGFNTGAAAPGVSYGLQWLLGPVCFSKFYAIVSLLILGLGAWCFFRQLKLAPAACVLGALAAVLNSTFFSVACWGVGAHDITAGMCFFALAALVDTTSPQRWLRVILAGMAVGMAVTEGADVGALFSLLVAAFLVYQAGTVAGPRVRGLTVGGARLLLVIVCALFLAIQAIHGLVDTSIEGIAGTKQDAQTKEARWNWATQWSLPPKEVLSLVAPGLFGYRTDTPDGGVYWGTMGRDPAWETYIKNGRQGPPPTGFLRYNGGGNYAGGLVVLVALWAALQSFRRRNPVFPADQQRWLWFWLGVAGLTLLLALGRFAPFYQFVYALPYFSTIRNPTKFLDLFSAALVILFAYGVDALFRQYSRPATPNGRWPGWQSWWKRAAKFDRYWVWGCGIAGLGLLLGWWAYAAQHEALVEYLQGEQIMSSPDAVASFSLQQAGWLVVVFFLGAGLLALFLSGAFAGGRGKIGGICLGGLLVADLGLANQPWIRYWNYEDKYASNPVIDIFRNQPYEHRVAIAPFETSPKVGTLAKIYRLEWLQQQFPYYNIQAFETVEMPRMPEDYAAFVKAVSATNQSWFHLSRAWQLEAVHYVLAPAGFDQFLAQPENAGPSLQQIARLSLERKPGVTNVRSPDQVTAVVNTDGPFALYALPTALPRARLFANWQVATNATDVLNALFDPAFDLSSKVFVAGGIATNAATATNTAGGTVDITHYAPKNIALQARVTQPSILLLADHFDPDWKVFVDGRPETLLRCDFLLRGVQLSPGNHAVEFKFQPPPGQLPVSLAAIVVALVALGVLGFWTQKTAAPAAAPGPRKAASSSGRKNVPTA